jgi:hypothetical protein
MLVSYNGLTVSTGERWAVDRVIERSFGVNYCIELMSKELEMKECEALRYRSGDHISVDRRNPSPYAKRQRGKDTPHPYS